MLFLAFMLAINWNLFVTPVIEDGDIATNAIKVQNAKHFRQLVGNSSRWHFQHPGPFFFYVFGAGETIFYDRLHLVPAPLNAEFLAEIIFSTASLFIAIYIFYVNVRAPSFPALAVLASILFFYAIGNALPSAAMVSLWPPYMALISFVVLVASCASVARGNWQHLPVLAFFAMVMIHSHVAQLLFATILGTAAIAIAIIRELRRRNFVQAVHTYRYRLAAGSAIVIFFALPILIDFATAHPNNVHEIRAYLRQHHGEHNSLSTALLYTCSFFTYYVTPEAVLAKPGATLGDLLNAESFVRVYWSIFLFVGLFAVISHSGSDRKTTPFVKLVFANIVLIGLLFLYWSWRMTGPMFTFNGFFFFSVQLLALFGVAALVAGGLGRSLKSTDQIALACASVPLLLLTTGVRNSYPGNPDVLPIVRAIEQKHIRDLVLTFTEPEASLRATGVASYLEREGIYFCVDPKWGYVFGVDHVCRKTDGFYKLNMSDDKLSCKSPCTVIYSHPKLDVALIPPGE